MKKVLVLENGMTISNLISHFFTGEECKILIPQNGSNFNGQIPDLIIADLTSIKKEKVELLMQLKNNHITSLVPFLLVVSENGTGTKEESSVQNYYLNKPFTRENLQILVKRILSHTDSLNPW
jgi:CheY-like chemotaxis protein